MLAAAVAYIDRILALVIDKEILPVFMLVVMCFAAVQMTIDFYFVSRHRRDFLEQRISIARAFTTPLFLRSLLGGLVLAIAGCVVVLRFARNGAAFPLTYVLIICALQVSVAVSAIAIEILFWSRKPARVLQIELGFWALFACAMLAAWKLHIAVIGVFTLAVACALIRLILYLVTATRLVPGAVSPRAMIV
jgi:hypothetical protein